MSSLSRVVLADDHPEGKAAVRALPNSTPDIEVVGEAEDGQLAVELAMALHPEPVVIDIHLPRLSGITASRQSTATWPAVRIIGLSAASEPPYARAMAEAGALELLDKTVSRNRLVTAISQLVTRQPSRMNTLAGLA